MEEDKEKQLKNGDETGKDPATGRFTKGNTFGKGRPTGSKNFTTDFDEVVDEIAKTNNITTSEARKILLKMAYVEAKKGNFPFYKDILDRYYGKAQDSVDITTAGQPLYLPSEVLNKYDTTSGTERDSEQPEEV
jgi:hypothetical protein